VVPEGVGVLGVPTVGVTLIVMAFDTAGLPVAQVAEEVISTVMISPFASAEDV
jgi:energy-converting hydrogenase Eha subunit E